jgi:TPR repeat protein
MKFLRNIFFLILLCFMFFSVSYADSIQEGMEAAQSGNYGKARDLWLPEAENGDPRAQYNLAYLYAQGLITTNLGLMTDLAETEKWFLKAAKQGLVEAQNALGVLYVRSLLRDYQKAEKWFLQAAQGGFPEAQRNLVSLYLDIIGTNNDADFKRALIWIRKSAMNGNPDSQYLLGGMYYEGKGVPKNIVEAYAWWVLADKNGHPKASMNIEHVRGKWDSQIIEDGKRKAAALEEEILGQ